MRRITKKKSIILFLKDDKLNFHMPHSNWLDLCSCTFHMDIKPLHTYAGKSVHSNCTHLNHGQ